ncbi:enoyl-CoA hydratase [Pararobbsia silviterrae]|uniref:Enoyl-CoA hydratase n=1 Tax=Pararobbsia silviterrae TaxID=1792498 RepID=A0A494Y9V3_9BURK|nr:enoyl-CoA hydratase [Pararobbsia silviterrae]RKP58915.1 enoyl-CoA hydratase [Pararobbsia silviterrae]
METGVESNTDVVVRRDGAVLVIAFNRVQKKNAITVAMYQAMSDGLAEAAADASVRAVLIHGDAQVFSAGNDLADFMKNPASGENAPVFQFLRGIANARKPIVAAVAGVAVGIGTTLLLHCDLVYAGDNARFSLPFTQLGLCPEAASSLLLPQLTGYQRAAEKLLLGEAFDAAEALAMGLVSRVLPAGEVNAFALAQAKKLAALPSASLRATKSLMKDANRPAVLARMTEEGAQFAKMLVAPEAREAFAAFMEKRTPNFAQFD